MESAVPSRPVWILGCAAGFLAVLLGAFGAHALKGSVTPERLAVFETGVRYQMFHALALIGASFIPVSRRSRFYTPAIFCLTAGMVLFSGSLYTLVLTDVRAWGAVTPAGGLLFLSGWLCLAVSFDRAPRRA